MLTIEKKVYRFIDKYLHFIVALVVAVVVLFMNRQTLYCVRPYAGADMWEASEVFVHSPLYVMFLRKVWIELFSADYNLYHMSFWIFSYSTAFLGAVVFHQYKKKRDLSHSIINTTVFFCFALITPLTLLYGPVMLHMDGISMTLILLSILLSKYLPSNVRWIPCMVGFTLVIALQSNYVFGALALIIYGVFWKRKSFVYIPLVSIVCSIILNLIVGICMDFSAAESMHMILRFFYMSQATGKAFTSILSWILYMIFWNGYWLGMYFLFKAFTLPQKAPVYVFCHIALFFFGVTIFFNGYIG